MRAFSVLAALSGLLLLTTSTNAVKCNCNCARHFLPVCAVDPQGVEETYSNECSYECYKCTHGKDLRISKQGECSDKGTGQPPQPAGNTGAQTGPTSKCNCRCAHKYDPICAADPKGVEETYPNQCAYECYKCTHGIDLRIRNKGECSGEKTGNSRPQKIPTGKCNCRCTYNYRPVCAVDPKGVEETYPNQCTFECYKCTHEKDLRIRKQGECSGKRTGQRVQPVGNTGAQTGPTSKCNCRCPQKYEPICAADSKGVEDTYPNQCSFECYKCTHKKDLRIRNQGECSGKTTGNTGPQKIPRGKCNCRCPFNYEPVCAIDPKGVEETYPNQCSFECYKCTHEKDIRIQKQGECAGKIPGQTTPSTGRTNKCKCTCTSDYSPLCAVNSRGVEKSFPNRCGLDCYNCLNGEDFVKRRDGECQQRNPSPFSVHAKSRTA